MSPGTVKPDIAKFPYSVFGRLDTFVDGTIRYCTARRVEGTNILLTAAHCVRDNESGNWVSDFRFWQATEVVSAGAIIPH
jgi:V8-like Glu-specific endopeptidase